MDKLPARRAKWTGVKPSEFLSSGSAPDQLLLVPKKDKVKSTNRACQDMQRGRRLRFWSQCVVMFLEDPSEGPRQTSRTPFSPLHRWRRLKARICHLSLWQSSFLEQLERRQNAKSECVPSVSEPSVLPSEPLRLPVLS